jgi:predicted signal transduction protein with EAL and GGDEF domain
MLASLRRPFDWFARQSRITKDLIVIGLLGLPIYVAAIWYDLFDKFLGATGQPDSDTLDWLVLLFVVLGIAAKIFSVRRVLDLREEVALRRKTEAEAFGLARLDVLTGLPNRRWFLEDYDRWAEGLTGNELARCS